MVASTALTGPVKNGRQVMMSVSLEVPSSGATLRAATRISNLFSDFVVNLFIYLVLKYHVITVGNLARSQATCIRIPHTY